MNFSSVNFLFLFLPLVLAVYSPLKSIRGKNIVLIIFSLIFYFLGEKAFTLLLLFSCVFNYILGKKLYKTGNKGVLIFGIIVNLAILGVFKYLNFIIDEINILLSFLNTAPITHCGVHLPVGISFFTFQAISYLVDIKRNEVKPLKPADFTLYLSMFPQLVAGPIIRCREIRDEIFSRNVSEEKFLEGIKRFISGLSKKVLIADTLSFTSDTIFSLGPGGLTGPVCLLGAVCYTFQIFYDFSGYSDMAIGLGKMFGFTFPENFNYPYISKSIKEFWQRWHMTLSRWFRDYLYIPLGGNRKGTKQTCLNIMIVFMLTGLWHGAAWNFIIWGLYNGALIVLERLWLLNIFKKLPKFLSHIYFTAAVIIGWTIFRSESLQYATSYIGAMFSRWNNVFEFCSYINYETAFTLLIALLLAFPLNKMILKAKIINALPKCIKSTAEAGFYAMLLIVSASYAAANTYQPFIYFRF